MEGVREWCGVIRCGCRDDWPVVSGNAITEQSPNPLDHQGQAALFATDVDIRLSEGVCVWGGGMRE